MKTFLGRRYKCRLWFICLLYPNANVLLVKCHSYVIFHCVSTCLCRMEETSTLTCLCVSNNGFECKMNWRFLHVTCVHTTYPNQLSMPGFLKRIRHNNYWIKDNFWIKTTWCLIFSHKTEKQDRICIIPFQDTGRLVFVVYFYMCAKNKRASICLFCAFHTKRYDHGVYTSRATL